MVPVKGKPAAWRFDSVVVDAAAFRVVIDGVPAALEPKSLRLLLFLIQERDRAVSKEEILQEVWGGTFVSDNALTRAVAQIRKAIGDDPRQPRYIETIPTLGYRFIAPVEEVASPAATPAKVSRASWWLVAAAVVLIATVALAIWGRKPAADQNVAFVPVQFSSSAGLDMGASFSPDGNLIAYASDKSGAFEIYVKSFDVGAAELQLTNDGNQNLYPAFSPDGRWVAFASTKRRGIFLVPAIGGPVRRLTEFGVQPVWSPDSRTIVFRSSEAASLSTTDYYWPAESNLWTVPVAGGEPTRLTGTGEPAGGQSFPSYSPDGAEIRFVNHLKGEASIWTYRVAGGAFRRVFASTEFRYSNATFAPDSARMWFVNAELNGNIVIWQLALNPKTLEPAGEAQPLSPSTFPVPHALALSPDGKRLAFTGTLSESTLMIQAIGDATPPTPLTRDTTYRYGLVRASRDGTRVAYTSFPRNGLPQVWVANADGSGAQAAGPPNFGNNQASLSRDNNRIFFGQRRPDGVWMVSLNLADRAARDLTRLPEGVNQIGCFDDCTGVLFHSDRDERRQVYLLDVATGTTRAIASGPEDVGFPRQSRDSKWISVEITHRPKGGDDIGVIPAGGGPIETVLRSDQPSYSAGWMPDNDRILFAGRREGIWNLYTVSRTSGKVERLTNYTSPRTYVRYPDWLAGNRMVYEFNETKGNIFVADVR